MALPGYLKKLRGEEPTVDRSAWPDVDYFDMVSDHARISTVVLNGTSIEYVPLTIAEEIELLQDPDQTNHLAYMLAKAYELRRRRGLHDSLDLGLSEAPLATAKRALRDIPVTTTLELLERIRLDREGRFKALESLIAYKEGELYEDRETTPKRQPNPWDPHVSSFYLLKDTTLGHLDVGSLTRLQYHYFVALNSEVQMRGLNNHNFMMAKGKADTGGKPEKQAPRTVGSR